MIEGMKFLKCIVKALSQAMITSADFFEIDLLSTRAFFKVSKGS